MKTVMGREDILRELELLPVWQQRHAPVSLQAASINPPDKPDIVAAISPVFRGYHNVQTRTLFVLAEDQPPAAETLLHNMLKAIAMQSSEKKPALALDQLTAESPQLIVAMGELVAQQLLGTQDKLENLRGSVHHYCDIALIATYAPNDLLQNALQKSEAWQDLCLVMTTLRGLQSQDSPPYSQ